MKRLVVLTLLGFAVAPSPVRGQTILGRVLDQFSEEPVDGVIVLLIARTGEERERALSDAGGRFVLTPPDAGEYLLVTDRFGYVETRSPLLSLTTEGQAPLDLMIAPAPIGLEGLEISVEERASEELSRIGLSVNALGNRWIDKERIDAIPVKLDVGTILERTAQAGLRISRPENLTMGSDDMGLCVAFLRVRRPDGGGTCALVVWNGVPMSGVGALDIDPYAIESIALLEPMEAAMQWGTLAGGGAVLIWTTR
jgi:hypothetical protein